MSSSGQSTSDTAYETFSVLGEEWARITNSKIGTLTWKLARQVRHDDGKERTHVFSDFTVNGKKVLYLPPRQAAMMAAETILPPDKKLFFQRHGTGEESKSLYEALEKGSEGRFDIGYNAVQQSWFLGRVDSAASMPSYTSLFEELDETYLENCARQLRSDRQESTLPISEQSARSSEFVGKSQSAHWNEAFGLALNLLLDDEVCFRHYINEGLHAKLRRSFASAKRKLFR